EADVRAAAAAAPLPAAAPPLQQVERGLGGEALSASPRPRAPASGLRGEVETDGFVRASPIARRLAREQGLDLGRVRGTGPDGRVIERDIVAALQQRDQAAAAAPVAVVPPSALPLPPAAGLTPRETIRLDGMRRVIAQRMHQSLQQMAQLTLTTEADAT